MLEKIFIRIMTPALNNDIDFLTLLFNVPVSGTSICLISFLAVIMLKEVALYLFNKTCSLTGVIFLATKVLRILREVYFFLPLTYLA